MRQNALIRALLVEQLFHIIVHLRFGLAMIILI
jgi:hypothetical protein